METMNCAKDLDDYDKFLIQWSAAFEGKRSAVYKYDDFQRCCFEKELPGIRIKVIKLLSNWDMIIRLISEADQRSFYKVKQNPVMNERAMKKYDLAGSLDMLNDFLWFSMMEIDYNGGKSLIVIERRNETFTDLLSKNGIDWERLAEAGRRMLQGEQVRDLNLKRRQFTVWCRLCKSLIPESPFELNVLTADQFESLNF
jgi:hypothetical protein